MQVHVNHRIIYYYICMYVVTEYWGSECHGIAFDIRLAFMNDFL